MIIILLIKKEDNYILINFKIYNNIYNIKKYINEIFFLSIVIFILISIIIILILFYSFIYIFKLLKTWL